MLIVLKTLVDIGKPMKDGSQKIIKRNVECKKTFDTNNISVEQYVKINGDISKKWCNLKEGDNYYRMNHSFDYITELISPLYIKGYKRYN